MQNEDIGFLIKQISDRIRAQIDAGMKESDITYSQFHVLTYLHDNGRSATQKEIETFLGVSHPTVVGLIARLNQKGLVAAEKDQKDKRIKIISMTDKALMLGDCVIQKHSEFEALMREGLSDDEISELIRLLNVVYSNINKRSCK